MNRLIAVAIAILKPCADSCPGAAPRAPRNDAGLAGYSITADQLGANVLRHPAAIPGASPQRSARTNSHVSRSCTLRSGSVDLWNVL